MAARGDRAHGDPAKGDQAKGEGARRRRQRWGVYTLLFLVLAFAMVVVSTTQHHYTVLTLLGLVIGFAGAGWCTYKGLRETDFRRLLK